MTSKKIYGTILIDIIFNFKIMKKLKQILLFLFITLNIFVFKVDADNQIISPQDILITDNEYFAWDNNDPQIYLWKKKFTNWSLSEKDLDDVLNYNNYFFNWSNWNNQDNSMYYNINLLWPEISNVKVFDFNWTEMTWTLIEWNNIKLYYDSFFDKVAINEWQNKRVFKYWSWYILKPETIKLTFNQNWIDKEVNFLFKFNIPKYEISNEIKYNNIKLNSDDEIKINFPNGFSSWINLTINWNLSFEENLLTFKILNKDKEYNNINIFFYKDYDFSPLFFWEYNYFSESFCEYNSKIYFDIKNNNFSQFNNWLRNSNKIINSKLKIEKYNSWSKLFEVVNLPWWDLDFPQASGLELITKLDILEKGIYRFSLTNVKDLYTELWCDQTKTKILYFLDNKWGIFIKNKEIPELVEESEIFFENLYYSYSLNLKKIMWYKNENTEYSYFLKNFAFDIIKDFSFKIKSDSWNIIYSWWINCLNSEYIDENWNQICKNWLKNSLKNYYSQTWSNIENLNLEIYYENIYWYKDFFLDKNFTNKAIKLNLKDSIKFINKSSDDEKNLYNYNFYYSAWEDSVLDINNKPFIITAKTNNWEDIVIDEWIIGDIDYWYVGNYNNFDEEWNNYSEINLFISKNIDIKDIKITFDDGRVYFYDFNKNYNEHDINKKFWDAWEESKIDIVYSSLDKPFDGLLFVSKYSFNYYDNNWDKILNNTNNINYYYTINDILITWTWIENINKKNIFICKKYFTNDIDVKKYCDSSLVNQYNIWEDLYVYWYNNLVDNGFTQLSIKILFEFWSILNLG